MCIARIAFLDNPLQPGRVCRKQNTNLPLFAAVSNELEAHTLLTVSCHDKKTDKLKIFEGKTV